MNKRYEVKIVFYAINKRTAKKILGYLHALIGVEHISKTLKEHEGVVK